MEDVQVAGVGREGLARVVRGGDGVFLVTNNHLRLLVAWALKYSLPCLFSPVHMMIRSTSVILGLELSDENSVLVRSFIIFAFILVVFYILCNNL